MPRRNVLTPTERAQLFAFPDDVVESGPNHGSKGVERHQAFKLGLSSWG